jgi:16S rRNA (cytosine967-C5)-methyltransferase
MRSHSYINSAKQIISDYDGSIPFVIWLKSYFKENKKYGSTDRRQISNLCFAYFRTFHLLNKLDVSEHLLTGLFLTSTSPSIVLEELNSGWNQSIHQSLHEKLKLIPLDVQLDHLFPFNRYLSKEINQVDFNKSFLVQPDVFLRLRPGNSSTVLDKLATNKIEFVLQNENCIRVKSNTAVDNIIQLDKEAVIQDINSQSVLNNLSNYISKNSSISMWDCCAASGGKSILFHDLFPNSTITVSDIRESILINLQKRFREAGLILYKKFIVDLTKQITSLQNFNLIICDAPCSGSGTWSRTPEQLKFFPEDRIMYYQSLQKKILSNVTSHIMNEGYLLYITCSVFKMENEDVLDFISSELNLNLLTSEYYKGYNEKADTLFAALFKVSEM